MTWIDGELVASPKPTGWSAEIESFLQSKADSSRAKALIAQIEAKCLAFVDKKDAVGLNKYLVGLMLEKPKGWDASVEKLCTQWLAKVTALIVDAENMRVMAAVRKALDKRDFATARKLTSVAVPFGEDEVVRNATLAFRICLLNTLINPYQGEISTSAIVQNAQGYAERKGNPRTDGERTRILRDLLRLSVIMRTVCCHAVAYGTILVK